jgi:adenosylcobinamide-GDP ribazoletransferase
MLRGFSTAVRTLSLIPMPGRDARELASALPWFPLVGALLGAALLGVLRGLDALGLRSWPEGEAGLLVLASTALTRGLHLDGLADWADGLFSMSSKERTLEIMKDSRVGAFGVLALLLGLGLKWVSTARLIGSGAATWIIPAFIVSRTVQADLAVALPYARESGGTAAPFVNGARPRHRVGAWALSATLLLAAGPWALGAALVGCAAAIGLGLLYKRRLGGITGDLLGAAGEMTETLLLVLFAALGPRLLGCPGWEEVL